MVKKVLFFDIDGTLLEYLNGITDITPKVKQAIHKAFYTYQIN